MKQTIINYLVKFHTQMRIKKYPTAMHDKTLRRFFYPEGIEHSLETKT